MSRRDGNGHGSFGASVKRVVFDIFHPIDFEPSWFVLFLTLELVLVPLEDFGPKVSGQCAAV